MISSHRQLGLLARVEEDFIRFEGLPLNFQVRASSNRVLFTLPLDLLFGNCGESYCDGRVADAPSPSKAHVQTAKAGVTSGAQDFENVEQFGYRYLNRADSEKSPRLNPDSKHISATQRACRSIRNYWRRVRSWCCDCADIKIHTWGWKGAVLFPFPYRPTD